MSRVFGRGQLKLALLAVAAEVEPANGYAIMHELDARIGGTWQPSPGAIYPALLALEDAGLLAGTDVDGARQYAVTDSGRRALAEQPDVIEAVADRAQLLPPPLPTFGALLDRLVQEAPHRQRRLDDPAARLVETRVRGLLDELARTAVLATPKETT